MSVRVVRFARELSSRARLLGAVALRAVVAVAAVAPMRAVAAVARRRAVAVVVPLVALAALATLAGCGTTGSDGIKTSDLKPYFIVQADAAGKTDIEARLFHEINSVKLKDGDRLAAIVGEDLRVMRFESNDDQGDRYLVSFEAIGADDEIRIALTREDERDALNSTVVLPIAAVIRGFDVGMEFAVGDTVDVAWSTSGTEDAVELVLTPVSCDAGKTGREQRVAVNGDPGLARVVLDAGLLGAVATGGLPGGGTCTVTLHLERTRAGSLDPGYEPRGIFEAVRRSEAVQFELRRP